MTRVNSKPTSPRPKQPEDCSTLDSQISSLYKIHMRSGLGLEEHDARITDLIILVSKLNDRVNDLERSK